MATAPILNMEKKSILFVCMGNICRSPTAEGVFRARAGQAGLAEDLHIDSAGTHAYHVGQSPDPRSTAFAARRGVDLSAQRARRVEAADFARFDYVIAMDHENMALLKAACPAEHRHKLHLFMAFATHSDSDVVPDPYYEGDDGFDLVLDYIEDASDGLIAAIR
jgi:protein-tyrosine phosphatase